MVGLAGSAEFHPYSQSVKRIQEVKHILEEHYGRISGTRPNDNCMRPKDNGRDIYKNPEIPLLDICEGQQNLPRDVQGHHKRIKKNFLLREGRGSAAGSREPLYSVKDSVENCGQDDQSAGKKQPLPAAEAAGTDL